MHLLILTLPKTIVNGTSEILKILHPKNHKNIFRISRKYALTFRDVYAMILVERRFKYP